MAMLDPLLAPYMQQALGGGQITERDMKQLLQALPAGGGLGGLLGPQVGMGPAAPMPQAPGVIEHGSSGRGMNSALVGSLLGGQGGGPGQATFNSGTGNWTPGPGGFPAPQGASMLMQAAGK